MAKWNADVMQYQIADLCSGRYLGEHKITYWNDYPISRIIVVAAAIKYLLEGLI